MDGHEPDVSSLMHPTGTKILERAGDLLVRALPGDKGREKILTVIDQERLLGMGGEKGMWNNVYEVNVKAADVAPFVEKLTFELEGKCSLYTPDLHWMEGSGAVGVRMRGLRKRVHQRTRLITHKPGDRQWGYVDVSQFSGAGEAYSYQHNVPRAGIVALMQGEVPPHATHHDLADWYDGQEPVSVVARYETVDAIRTPSDDDLISLLAHTPELGAYVHIQDKVLESGQHTLHIALRLGHTGFDKGPITRLMRALEARYVDPNAAANGIKRVRFAQDEVSVERFAPPSVDDDRSLAQTEQPYDTLHRRAARRVYALQEASFDPHKQEGTRRFAELMGMREITVRTDIPEIQTQCMKRALNVVNQRMRTLFGSTVVTDPETQQSREMNTYYMTETFLLALSLGWLAGTTPAIMAQPGGQGRLEMASTGTRTVDEVIDIIQKMQRIITPEIGTTGQRLTPAWVRDLSLDVTKLLEHFKSFGLGIQDAKAGRGIITEYAAHLGALRGLIKQTLGRHTSSVTGGVVNPGAQVSLTESTRGERMFDTALSADVDQALAQRGGQERSYKMGMYDSIDVFMIVASYMRDPRFRGFGEFLADHQKLMVRDAGGRRAVSLDAARTLWDIYTKAGLEPGGDEFLLMPSAMQDIYKKAYISLDEREKLKLRADNFLLAVSEWLQQNPDSSFLYEQLQQNLPELMTNVVSWKFDMLNYGEIALVMGILVGLQNKYTAIQSHPVDGTLEDPELEQLRNIAQEYYARATYAMSDIRKAIAGAPSFDRIHARYRGRF